MKYSIIFSAYAVETYDLMFEQITLRWGAKIAADFEMRVFKLIETIEKSPYIYQSLDQDPSLRKGILHANCSVIYEVKEQEIEIHFFWDNRQDSIL